MTMKRTAMMVLLAAGLLTDAADAALLESRAAAAGGCGPDAVIAGTACLDTYEASVWRVPNPTTTNAPLVKKIQLGRATQADLVAAGATQLGLDVDDFAPCAANGQNCTNDIFAVSLRSVFPAAHITWFQAQEACANAGKRLPTNAEWQVGANGTPDPGPDNGTTDCNSDTDSASPTGARSGCVSARGAFDMVGNLDEWVADWVPLSTNCPGWGGLSDDFMCFAGASTALGGPGALLRGGDYRSRSSAGPLAVVGSGGPSSSARFVGFRCVREPSRALPRVQGPVEQPIDREAR
jgi:formylglycine-generating enzyme required for sulfatase activity